MILRKNSLHFHESNNSLVFLLTLIFFLEGSEMLGEMLHLKRQIGLRNSPIIEAPTLPSEHKEYKNNGTLKNIYSCC
jgi:hypothetical protein